MLRITRAMGLYAGDLELFPASLPRRGRESVQSLFVIFRFPAVFAQWDVALA